MPMRRVFCVGLTLTASLMLAVPSLRGHDLQKSISVTDRFFVPVVAGAQNTGADRPFGLQPSHYPFAPNFIFSSSHTENAGLTYGGNFNLHALPDPGTVALLAGGWASIIMIHRHYRKSS